MNALLLLLLALSLVLNVALFSWAMNERNHRQWQQAQLYQLRQQMWLVNGGGASNSGRWLTWLLILGLLIWLAATIW